MKLWVLMFEDEVAGIYSTFEQAVEAVPFEAVQWECISDIYATFLGEDVNGDEWFIFSLALDTPPESTYQTW